MYCRAIKVEKIVEIFCHSFDGFLLFVFYPLENIIVCLTKTPPHTSAVEYDLLINYTYQYLCTKATWLYFSGSREQ